jgi:hypothetical protein
MYESHMILLNSTVPYTGGANVAGTLLSLTLFTIIAILVITYFRNK